MWTPRTTPVKQGEQPFAWDVPSVWQCTWFAYYEALYHGLSAPCWWDRATQTGSYTNAKLWLENYRDPWEAKDASYVPVAGDIPVYDGQYGHVQFMETDAMYAEYKSGREDSFANGKFERKSNLLGFLHFPYKEISPVERNENVNQIKTTDESLRIRKEPSLNGEIVGHVQLGYYNVLQTREADGYTWYELGINRWCASTTTIYLPKQKDIIAEIQRYFDAMKSEIGSLENENDELKKKLKEIEDICSR